MNFALAIYASPASASSYSALQFARAALDNGHAIHRVFFYADGVYNGNALAAPPQDESNLCQLWSELRQHSEQKGHAIDLCLCIAAGVRRGVLDEGEAKRAQKYGANMHDAFSVGGLGQLLDAANSADRLITFG